MLHIKYNYNHLCKGSTGRITFQIVSYKTVHLMQTWSKSIIIGEINT